MSTGGVFFRGNKTDIDMVEDLINQLPVSEEDFNNMPNENNIVKTFLTNFIDYYGEEDWVFEEIWYHSYDLKRLEENLLFLDIGYEGRSSLGQFYSEEWASAFWKNWKIIKVN
ncbi:hypothetical protein AGMMS50230_11670 [Spirochaetia bacterium]|nr:hypothetical protein AGMMS50230_11670 [Spirochaetia bacterium]